MEENSEFRVGNGQKMHVYDQLLVSLKSNKSHLVQHTIT